MSYLVLARKYRPRTFDEVVGQSHVTETLANAISSDRVGHAYLFSGPRGVGKTTTARLLAKSLNCPNAEGASACDKCDVCREITVGISLDVIEIDAASNRGIDEIRNLRENVKYAPAGGKYKVYVVDEVHMLTDAAFNALLKTLEEPPAHVKFVLATTAPLKVPETILSRCQRFEFVRIPTKSIFAKIKDICSREGFKVSDDVLMLISRRANGSLRDAESMLDQLVSAGFQEADESAVARLLGLSGAESFFSIMDAVINGEAKKALELLGDLFDRGTNLDEFIEGFIEHLRNLLLIKIHPDLASLVEASAGHMKRYQEQAKKFTEGDLLRLIHLASGASFSVRHSELPRLHLETAVVEMAYLDSTAQVSQLLERLDRLEASVRSGSVSAADSKKQDGNASDDAAPRSRKATGRTESKKPAPPEPEPKDATQKKGQNETAERTRQDEQPGRADRNASERSQNTETEKTPEITKEIRGKWREILKRLDTRKKTLGVCLSSAEFLGIFHGKAILSFEHEKSFEQGFVESKENRTLLKEELADVFKVALGVSCVRVDSRHHGLMDDVELESFMEEEGAKGNETSPEGEAPPEQGASQEDSPQGPTDSDAGADKNDSVKTIIDFFDGEIIEEQDAS